MTPPEFSTIPSYVYIALLQIQKLSQERVELKDALYAKEKELSEAIYSLKPGAKPKEKK